MIFRRTAAIVALSFCVATHANAQFARTEVLAFESEDKTLEETLNGSAGRKLQFAGILRIPKAGQKIRSSC